MAPKKAPKGEAKPAKAAAPAKEGKAAAQKKQDPKKKESGKKGAKSTQENICAVLVRKLEFEGMCHETVKDVFKNCGGILGVRLRHGKYTLIFFKSAAHAKKALEMNNKTVKGNKIQVLRAKRARLPKKREGYCKTVWVGPLPGGTTKLQLKKHFESCGAIKKVRVYPSRKHGFVYFKKPAEALKAVAMKDAPFSHAKDVSKMEKVPKELQWKWDVKLSIRTRTGDKLKNERRFNRRPPSEIERKNKKSEARAALRKAAKEKEEKKKASGGSTTKKDSTTKKEEPKKVEAKPAVKEAAPAKPASKKEAAPAKPEAKKEAAPKPAPKEAKKEAAPAPKKEAKKEAAPAPAKEAAKKGKK